MAPRSKTTSPVTIKTRVEARVPESATIVPRSDKVASRERGAELTANLGGEIEADHNAAASAHEEDTAADRRLVVSEPCMCAETHRPIKSKVREKLRQETSDGRPRDIWRRDSHRMAEEAAQMGMFM